MKRELYSPPCSNKAPVYISDAQDDSFQLICEALAQSSSINILDIFPVHSLGPEGALHIALMISNTNSLTALTIWNGDIGPEGAKLIAESISHNHSLRRLGIKANGIEDEGANYLAKALAQNTSLTHLDISDNNIGSDGALGLASMIETNQSITELNLKDNKLNDDGVTAIKNAMERNRICHKCWLDDDLPHINAEIGSVISSLTSQDKQLRKIESLITSDIQRIWFRRIKSTDFIEDVCSLPTLRAKLKQEIDSITELQCLSKLNSPVTILLDGASSLVVNALLSDLGRPFVVMTSLFGFESLLSLIQRNHGDGVIIVVQDVHENQKQVKEFFEHCKQANIDTKSLTILATTTSDHAHEFSVDKSLPVRLGDTCSIHEYLLATTRNSKTIKLAKEELPKIAEKLAGCKRYYGANFVSRFWHSYTEYTNLSPSDVDSLLIESALCKTGSEVTLEDIERVLDSSRQSFYEGHAKAMEAKIISPQDCQEMTLRFNFFLRRKRIRVIWLNQWSSSASINLGRLNEVQWEVVEHLLSIEVAVGQVWCYYLRVNDDLTWRLGPPIRIDLPSAHSTVHEHASDFLETDNNILRDKLRRLEELKVEHEAALRLIKRNISNFPYEELMFEETLGEGSFGSVRKATWYNQKFAIKELKRTALNSPVTVLAEAKILSQVRHKHIVLLMGTSTNPENNQPALVLEYMKHGSLHDLLAKRKVKLSRSEIVQIALDVAKGLDHLHSLTPQIIHRDLKSANILLYQKSKRAKLTDFGTAKWFSQDTIFTGETGTLGFMAPEVLAWEPIYSYKVDVYSFGVVLFHMLSNAGLPPVIDETSREKRINEAIRNEDHFDLKQLVIHCCKQNPAHRPDMSEVLGRLKQMK